MEEVNKAGKAKKLRGFEMIKSVWLDEEAWSGMPCMQCCSKHSAVHDVNGRRSHGRHGSNILSGLHVQTLEHVCFAVDHACHRTFCLWCVLTSDAVTLTSFVGISRDACW